MREIKHAQEKATFGLILRNTLYLQAIAGFRKV